MSRHANRITLGVFFRSTTLWLIMSLLVIIYTVLIILMLPIKVRARHKIATSWAFLFTFLVKHICRVNYKVTGLEHLIKGPAIIASNHQSTWETFAYPTIFPSHVWVLKRELFKIPFFGLALRCLAPIAIDRSKRSQAIKQVLTQGAQRIVSGFWILVFPEGTRVAPNIDAPYKNGLAKLALGLNLAIVPVAHNAGYCMPRRSFFIYPGTIEIKIGEAIYPSSNLSIEELTSEIKHSITNLYKTLK